MCRGGTEINILQNPVATVDSREGAWDKNFGLKFLSSFIELETLALVYLIFSNLHVTKVSTAASYHLDGFHCRIIYSKSEGDWSPH
jgi:hypothetical protein